MLPAFLTALLFSLSAVFARRSTHFLGGSEANFWRLTMATVFLFSLSTLMGHRVEPAGFSWFFLSGIIGFGLGDLALFQALPRLGSRLTMLLVHCFAAPIAALLEWLWLGTRLSTVQLLYGGIILVGVGVALAPDKRQKGDRRSYFIGTVFGLISAFGQGSGALISRKAFFVADAAGTPLDGITAAFERILGGLLLTSFWFLFLNLRPGAPPPTSWKNRFRASHWVFLNALVGPALGVSCYQWALHNEPTGVVLPIVATTPLLVIPLARVMENDRMSLRSALGGIIAVFGAIGLALHRH